MFLRIRGESIKFSSHLKKKQMEKEEALVKDIEYLESLEKPHNAQLEILTDKKEELETIRSYKIQGEVRQGHSG